MHRRSSSISIAPIITASMEYDRAALAEPETRLDVAHYSPSFRLLERLVAQSTSLDDLTWRQFEELLRDLLQNDGYTVELGPGTKDGGKDLFAVKDLGESGLVAAVWQAKKKERSKKVGLGVIRELADTRNEHGASKGVIATTTYLTRGALERVQRDRYTLGKVDRDDLMQWMEKTLRG